MALPDTSAWWQNWRSAVGQAAVTGQISPNTATQAVYGGALADVQARYDTEAQRQNLVLQGRQVATQEKSEAAQESQFGQSLAEKQSEFATTSDIERQKIGLGGEQLKLQQEQLAAQKKAEMVSGITTGVGVGAYAIPKVAPYLGKAYDAITGMSAPLAESGYTGAGIYGGEAGAAVASEAAAGLVGGSGELGALGAGMYEAGAEAGSLIGTEATIGAELGPYGWAAAAVAIAVTVAVEETIVCTEMHRQGAIDDSTRRSASKYSRMVSPELYRGYLMVFGPVVRLMQNSRLASALIKPFGVAFSKEVAHRANPRFKGSMIGSVLISVFSPICLATHWMKRKIKIAYNV